jgi:hypothetical protein
MRLVHLGIAFAMVGTGINGSGAPEPVVSPHTTYGTFCVPQSAIPRTLPARVTLVTGDVVTIRMTSSECLKIDIVQLVPGEIIHVTSDATGHIVAVPAAVDPVIASSLDDGGMVDRRVFDVTAHIDDEYDDASRPLLGLTVMYQDLVTASAVVAGRSGVFGDELVNKTLNRSISSVAGDLWKNATSGASFRRTLAELSVARAAGTAHAVRWIEYDHKTTLEW